jgi:hypothetical protein
MDVVKLLHYTLYGGNKLWFLQRTVYITATHEKSPVNYHLCIYSTAHAGSSVTYSKIVLLLTTMCAPLCRLTSIGPRCWIISTYM